MIYLLGEGFFISQLMQSFHENLVKLRLGEYTQPMRCPELSKTYRRIVHRSLKLLLGFPISGAIFLYGRGRNGTVELIGELLRKINDPLCLSAEKHVNPINSLSHGTP